MKTVCLNTIERQFEKTATRTFNTTNNRHEETYKEGAASFGILYNSLPHLLTKTMAENLSPSVAFYSILHLANEHRLRLYKTTKENDMNVFLIRQLDKWHHFTFHFVMTQIPNSTPSLTHLGFHFRERGEKKNWHFIKVFFFATMDPMEAEACLILLLCNITIHICKLWHFFDLDIIFNFFFLEQKFCRIRMKVDFFFFCKYIWHVCMNAHLNYIFKINDFFFQIRKFFCFPFDQRSWATRQSNKKRYENSNLGISIDWWLMIQEMGMKQK